MTLQDFIKKYTGKFVEYHSYSANSKYQCVDLANQWITEGLGLTAIIGTNAQDFPSKKGVEFNYIVNTPSGLPLPGDLMIFKSTDGVGHISIFVEGNLSLFRSFDQNYPTSSPCRIIQHNYKNVLGWMRPIQTSTETMPNDDLNKILTHYNVKTADEFIASNDQQLQYLEDARKELKEAKDKISSYETTIGDANKSHEKFVQKLIDKINPQLYPIELTKDQLLEWAVNNLIVSESNAIKQAKEVQTAMDVLEKEKKDEIEQLKTEVKNLKIDNDNKARQIKNLSDRIDAIENPTVSTSRIMEAIKKLLSVFKKET